MKVQWQVSGFKLTNDGQDTRAVQHYVGHKNIQHTVRYTELSPQRFREFWKDLGPVTRTRQRSRNLSIKAMHSRRGTPCDFPPTVFERPGFDFR
jgi:hypothetical protein